MKSPVVLHVVKTIYGLRDRPLFFWDPNLWLIIASAVTEGPSCPPCFGKVAKGQCELGKLNKEPGIMGAGLCDAVSSAQICFVELTLAKNLKARTNRKENKGLGTRASGSV